MLDLDCAAGCLRGTSRVGPEALSFQELGVKGLPRLLARPAVSAARAFLCPDAHPGRSELGLGPVTRSPGSRETSMQAPARRPQHLGPSVSCPPVPGPSRPLPCAARGPAAAPCALSASFSSLGRQSSNFQLRF